MKRALYLFLACACFYKAGTLNAPAPIIQRQPQAKKPVVTVDYATMRLLGSNGGGTGFQVNYADKQYVLTNDHVCGLADSEGHIMAVPTYGRVSLLSVLRRSQTTDLCLLTAIPGLPGINLATKDAAYLEKIAVVGHPHLDKITWSVGKAGVLETIELLEYPIDSEEALAGCVGPKHHMEPIYYGLMQGCIVRVAAQQTSVPIAPGNSGSPVLNAQRRLVGVVFAASNSGVPSYMVPLHDVKAFLDETHK